MTKKKPLTPEQLKECAAAHDIFLKKKNELKLSQKKIADAANMSASAVNLYFKGVNSLNLPFAIVLSKALSVPISEFSPRLAAEAEEISKTTARAAPQPQDAAKAVDTPNHITIKQYSDVRGAMGKGAYLLDTEGEIVDWRVTAQWASNQLPANTGIENLRIITGLGDSMKGLYNSGDPLIVDTGIRAVDYDAVYFFRVGDEGYVKRLQKTPKGILVISQNRDYRDWMIEKGMDLEIFGRVLKVWEGKEL